MFSLSPPALPERAAAFVRSLDHPGLCDPLQPEMRLRGPARGAPPQEENNNNHDNDNNHDHSRADGVRLRRGGRGAAGARFRHGPILGNGHLQVIAAVVEHVSLRLLLLVLQN